MDLESLVLSKSELSTLFHALLDPTADPAVTQERLLLAFKLHPYLSGSSSSLVPESGVSVQVFKALGAPLDYYPLSQSPAGTPDLRAASGSNAGSHLDLGVDPSWIIGTRNGNNCSGLLSPSPTPSPSRPLSSFASPFALAPMALLPVWPPLSSHTAGSDDLEMLPPPCQPFLPMSAFRPSSPDFEDEFSRPFTPQTPTPQSLQPLHFLMPFSPSPPLTTSPRQDIDQEMLPESTPEAEASPFLTTVPLQNPSSSPHSPLIRRNDEEMYSPLVGIDIDNEMSWPATPQPSMPSPFSSLSPLTPLPVINGHRLPLLPEHSEDGSEDWEPERNDNGSEDWEPECNDNGSEDWEPERNNDGSEDLEPEHNDNRSEDLEPERNDNGSEDLEPEHNDNGSEDLEQQSRGSSLELEIWLNNGNPVGGQNGNNGLQLPPAPPPGLPPAPPGIIVVVDPNCPRGGAAARLLQQAANRTREEARRRNQWNLEGGRHNEQEGQEEEQENQPAHAPAAYGAVDHLSTQSFNPIFPTASSLPLAEDPPPETAIREFLLAVSAQARKCLPGFIAGREKSSTTPDQLIQWIIKSSSPTQQTLCPPMLHTALDGHLHQIIDFSAPTQQSITPALLVPPTTIMGSTTLNNILSTASICCELEVADAVVQLKYWLNSIKLACLVNRYVVDHQTTQNKVWDIVEPYLKRCRKTLNQYVKDGIYACRLVGSGSFYLLVFMACARIRPHVRDLKGDTVGKLAKFIRYPTDSPQGVLIKKEIIPAVAYLRQQYPLHIGMFFPTSFLETVYQPQLEGSQLSVYLSDIDCTNLVATDEILDSIYLYNDFMKGRDWHSWLECTTAVTSSSYSLNSLDTLLLNSEGVLVRANPTNESSNSGSYLPGLHPESHSCQTASSSFGFPFSPAGNQGFLPRLDWDSPMTLPTLITVDTNFDPKLEYNTRLKFSRSDREDRWKVTEEERSYAMKAIQPNNLADFKKKLTSSLSKGRKTSPQKYIYFDSKWLDSQMIRINNKYAELIALICANMPKELRDTLLAKVQVIYPNTLRVVDTALEGSTNSFPSAHFTVWFRYSTRGDGTPFDADPSTLQKEGLRRVNTSQNIPRSSRELKDNSDEYRMFIEAFGPVFEWIEHLVKCLLPDSFDKLEFLVSVLPNCDTSPVSPFSGFVLNINVSTRIHRDWGDEDICLVLVISDCEGGELCLVEPGVVLKLYTGDVVIFKSADISHLNLHYRGRRASLVFHTDKAARGWAKDRNGWDHNMYMRSTSHIQPGARMA